VFVKILIGLFVYSSVMMCVNSILVFEERNRHAILVLETQNTLTSSVSVRCHLDRPQTLLLGFMHDLAQCKYIQYIRYCTTNRFVLV
jgi:hypothetical protein